MTESPIRRACNRCHAQKLSCKRSGDEPCERCIRLKAECKSSPSLRYRKNQHPNVTPEDLSRPPKRKRTYEESGLAQDELSMPGHPNIVARANTKTVSETNAGESSGDMIQLAMNQVPDPGVAFPQAYPATDLSNFGFDFGPAELYGRTANTPDLSHQPFHRRRGNGFNHLLDPEDALAPWSHQLTEASSPYSDTDLFSSIPTGDDKGQTFHSQHASLSLLPTPTHQQTSRTFINSQLSAPTGRHRIMLKTSPRQVVPEGKWLAEISDINGKLWDVTASIPVLTDSLDDTDIYTYRPIENRELASDPSFSIDSMFKLSRRFINTLQEITASFPADSSSATSVQPISVPKQQLDPGSSLLILSTYVRLLELFQKAFHLVNLELSVTGGKEPLQLCKLPDVSLGSFQVVSSQNLQMILTIRLAEDFLADLRGAISLLNAASTPNLDATGGSRPSSLFSSVVAVSLNEVTVRERQIQNDLSTIRRRLETS